jgi:hypothetical protein
MDVFHGNRRVVARPLLGVTLGDDGGCRAPPQVCVIVVNMQVSGSWPVSVVDSGVLACGAGWGWQVSNTGCPFPAVWRSGTVGGMRSVGADDRRVERIGGPVKAGRRLVKSRDRQQLTLSEQLRHGLVPSSHIGALAISTARARIAAAVARLRIGSATRPRS